MPTSDGNLTYREAAALVLNAGWTGEDAVKAVAIMAAENGGVLDPDAFNNIPPDLSYGLMQINMLGDLGPYRRKKYGIARNEDLFNPSYNVAIAYRIYTDAGKQFTDWSTYLHGNWVAYRAFAQFGISQAKTGGMDKTIDALNKNLKVQGWKSPKDALKDILKASSVGGAIVGDAVGVGDPLNAIGTIADFVTDQQNWFRIAAVLGGVLLIALAVFLLVSDTIVGQLTRKVARGVGKAAQT